MNPKNPQAASEGFVLVPREATSEMLRTLMSGEHSYDYREGNGYRREELDEHYQSMYRAMLAAAPAIAPGGDDAEELAEWRAMFQAFVTEGLRAIAPDKFEPLWPCPWRQDVAMVAYALHRRPLPAAGNAGAVDDAVPGWVLAAIKSADAMLEEHGYAHTDLRAAHGWLVDHRSHSYEWFDAIADTWKPINRLPHQWEREVGIQWRVALAPAAQQEGAPPVFFVKQDGTHGEYPPADPPAAGDVRVVVADLRRLGKEDGWLCATAGADMIEALLAAQEASRG